MKHFVAVDHRGMPLAKLSAPTEQEADAFAVRKVLGYHKLLEVRTLARKDIERRLHEAFRSKGLSEVSAEVAVSRNNVAALRSYEAGASPTAEPLRDLTEGDKFVLGSKAHERPLFEAFKQLGMNEKAARIAAERKFR